MKSFNFNSTGDYTKGFYKIGIVLLMTFGLFAQTTSAAAPRADFTGWHLPLPAGEWRISRGPCQSPLPNDHQCDYYEDECSFDFISTRGTMEGVPVLAPQTGTVFFIGQRTDAGNALLLRHADGRVSAFMHLARIVVALDAPVTQGQVVGYAGSTGSSGNPHLHFFIQPNAVERQCVDLQGLDEINLKMGTATSRNLAWGQLTLPDPLTVPQQFPAQAVTPQPGTFAVPQRLLLAPGAVISFPSRLSNARQPSPTLTAPLTSGSYTQTLRFDNQTVSMRYTVRPSAVITQLGVIAISPTFLRPVSYATFTSAPLLCWTETASAGKPPFTFRVMLVGSQSPESGWITNTCWQPPPLTPGTYYWKVFIRDARGFMNRTNQRPYAFVIR